MVMIKVIRLGVVLRSKRHGKSFEGNEQKFWFDGNEQKFGFDGNERKLSQSRGVV